MAGESIVVVGKECFVCGETVFAFPDDESPMCSHHDLSEEEMKLLVKISDAGIRYLRNQGKGEAPETVLFAVLNTFHKARKEL